MCDYSLENLQSRPAKVGDKLVTTVFTNTITRGFAEAGGDPNVAVCVLPGTELAFNHNVMVEHALGFFPSTVIKGNTARFRKLDPKAEHIHHDALEFPSGCTVLLTRLSAGQIATVLQMPVTEATTAVDTQEQPVLEPAE